MSHTTRPYPASTEPARPSRGVSRLVAALTVGVAAIALTACSEMTDAVDEALGEPTGSSGAPNGPDAATQLAELTVAAEQPMTDYSGTRSHTGPARARAATPARSSWSATEPMW